VGYTNAGTVEFIADQEANFYFLEMNTRLQVEHPITEMVTGIDLAKLQIRIAAGEKLPFTQDDLSQRGHAIECRVYAEDVASGFLPATGTILLASEPEGPGIRVDAGVVTGDSIGVHYDPMIAKLIVLAENRDEAIRRMDQALGEYVILGVTTNLAFLQVMLRHPAFQAGEISTHFIDEHLANWQSSQDELPDAALIAAALAQMQSQPSAASVGSAEDGDMYSPWARQDSFRIGGQ
jgi:acetyl/propionyl-CoA carboxylase alpha subunit